MISISDLKKTEIIAEIGSVHDGSFGNALKLIETAKYVGADTVKFQTHISEEETTVEAPSPKYFKNETRFDYFNRTAFTSMQWSELNAFAKENNIEFLSSPFSIKAVDLLENIGITKYKIPSGEITNTPLLKYIAQTKKPIMLSTGMSNWSEIDIAVNEIRKVHDMLVIMQCTSLYPCPLENVGLNLLKDISKRYNCPVGFSDHTDSNISAFAAVTLGATVIEKHLAFSRYMYGSDAQFSATPEQFIKLTKGIRELDLLFNSQMDKRKLSKIILSQKKIFEKSIVAKRIIKKGEKITHNNVAFKKPGTGIKPSELNSILGKKLKVSLKKDSIIDLHDLD